VYAFPRHCTIRPCWLWGAPFPDQKNCGDYPFPRRTLNLWQNFDWIICSCHSLLILRVASSSSGLLRMESNIKYHMLSNGCTRVFFRIRTSYNNGCNNKWHLTGKKLLDRPFILTSCFVKGIATYTLLLLPIMPRLLDEAGNVDLWECLLFWE